MSTLSTRDVVPFAKVTVESDEGENKVMQNTFTFLYVIRCTSVNDPTIRSLKVKHTVGLPNCANVVVDEDGVICVA